MSPKPAQVQKEEESPLYHRMVQVAIILAFLSLVAMGFSSYSKPDADNQPGPFSCTLLPVDGVDDR